MLNRGGADPTHDDEPVMNRAPGTQRCRIARICST
jgi:hypothetical protein